MSFCGYIDNLINESIIWGLNHLGEDFSSFHCAAARPRIYGELGVGGQLASSVRADLGLEPGPPDVAAGG